MPRQTYDHSHDKNRHINDELTTSNVNGIDRLNAIFGDGPHACAKCGATDALEVDHIVPKRKGGQHNKKNLQILCAKCHSAKSLTDMSGTPSESIKVTVGTLTFSSIKDMERKTGIPCASIKYYMKNGTIDDIFELRKKQVKRGRSISFARSNNPIHYRGHLYLSKSELKRVKKLGTSAITRAFFYGSCAWSLKCYRKSRRWQSLERHMHDFGERSCGECGRPADRLALVEVWTDLMVRPFDLETYAICGPCRKRVDANIKPLIDDAVNRYKNIIQSQPKTHDADGNLTPTEYRQRLMDFRRRQRSAKT